GGRSLTLAVVALPQYYRAGPRRPVSDRALLYQFREPAMSFAERFPRTNLVLGCVIVTVAIIGGIVLVVHLALSPPTRKLLISTPAAPTIWSGLEAPPPQTHFGPRLYVFPGGSPAVHELNI